MKFGIYFNEEENTAVIADAHKMTKEKIVHYSAMILDYNPTINILLNDDYGRLPEHPCYGCETTSENLMCAVLQEDNKCLRRKVRG